VIFLGLEAELYEVETNMQIELNDPCAPHPLLRHVHFAWLDNHGVPKVLAGSDQSQIDCQDNGVLNSRYSVLVRVVLSKFEKDERFKRAVATLRVYGCRMGFTCDVSSRPL